MKKFIAASTFVLLMSFPVFAWGQEETKKGASEQAYEHAGDNAVFNRVSDWFATIGKSDEDREKILAERKAKRAARRVEKEARQIQRETEREAKKAQRGLDEAGQKTKAKAGAAGRGMEGFIKGQGKGRNK